MNAVITGVTGFTGSYLAEHLLAEGDRVLGCSRPRRVAVVRPGFRSRCDSAGLVGFRPAAGQHSSGAGDPRLSARLHLSSGRSERAARLRAALAQHPSGGRECRRDCGRVRSGCPIGTKAAGAVDQHGEWCTTCDPSDKEPSTSKDRSALTTAMAGASCWPKRSSPVRQRARRGVDQGAVLFNTPGRANSRA